MTAFLDATVDLDEGLCSSVHLSIHSSVCMTVYSKIPDMDLYSRLLSICLKASANLSFVTYYFFFVIFLLTIHHITSVECASDKGNAQATTVRLQFKWNAVLLLLSYRHGSVSVNVHRLLIGAYITAKFLIRQTSVFFCFVFYVILSS